jgi:hypothetical protein
MIFFLLPIIMMCNHPGYLDHRPVLERSPDSLYCLEMLCAAFMGQGWQIQSLLHLWNVNSNHNSGKPSQFLQDVLFIGAVYYKRRNQSTTAALCPKRTCFRCLTLYCYCLSVSAVGSSEWVIRILLNKFQKDVYIFKLQ